MGPGFLASDNLQLTIGQTDNIQMGNLSNLRLGDLLYIWLDIKIGNSGVMSSDQLWLDLLIRSVGRT